MQTSIIFLLARPTIRAAGMAFVSLTCERVPALSQAISIFKGYEGD